MEKHIKFITVREAIREIIDSLLRHSKRHALATGCKGFDPD